MRASLPRLPLFRFGASQTQGQEGGFGSSDHLDVHRDVVLRLECMTSNEVMWQVVINMTFSVIILWSAIGLVIVQFKGVSGSWARWLSETLTAAQRPSAWLSACTVAQGVASYAADLPQCLPKITTLQMESAPATRQHTLPLLAPNSPAQVDALSGWNHKHYFISTVTIGALFLVALATMGIIYLRRLWHARQAGQAWSPRRKRLATTALTLILLEVCVLCWDSGHGNSSCCVWLCTRWRWVAPDCCGSNPSSHDWHRSSPLNPLFPFLYHTPLVRQPVAVGGEFCIPGGQRVQLAGGLLQRHWVPAVDDPQLHPPGHHLQRPRHVHVPKPQGQRLRAHTCGARHGRWMVRGPSVVCGPEPNGMRCASDLLSKQQRISVKPGPPLPHIRAASPLICPPLPPTHPLPPTLPTLPTPHPTTGRCTSPS